MKKHFRTLWILGLLLIVCLGVVAALVRVQEAPELAENNLSIEPDFVTSDGAVQWQFGSAEEAWVEAELLAPIRQKYDISDTEDAFSRCSSSVDYFLADTEAHAVFEEGYFYGTLTIFLGCGGPESYPFRVSQEGSSVEIENEPGTFVLMDEWARKE